MFLGEPIYTYAVVLASLLIFTGLGSYVIGKQEAAPEGTLSWVPPLVLLVVLATAIATPAVFQVFLGYGLPARIVIAVLLIGPLAALTAIVRLRALRARDSVVVPQATS